MSQTKGWGRDNCRKEKEGDHDVGVKLLTLNYLNNHPQQQPLITRVSF